MSYHQLVEAGGGKISTVIYQQGELLFALLVLNMSKIIISKYIFLQRETEKFVCFSLKTGQFLELYADSVLILDYILSITFCTRKDLLTKLSSHENISKCIDEMIKVGILKETVNED